MRWTLIILLSLLVFSCKKAEDRRCFKSVGKEVTIERNVDSFDKIYVGPNMKITLVQDSLDKVVITGGDNLVNFISSDVVDGQLRIENNNTCNFLRSYKHEVSVEIHFTSLKEFYFEGTKPVNCIGTIKSNNLIVVIRDGAGAVNLNVDCGNLNVTVTNGWGNFEVSGTTVNLHLDIRSNGFGNTNNLVATQDVNVSSDSGGVIQVNAEGAVLKAQTSSSGDIWYVGTPSDIQFTQYGTGELIDKN